MPNWDPTQPVNGKKLILTLGVGVVLFAVVMGFGTFFLAKEIAPLLRHTSPTSEQSK